MVVEARESNIKMLILRSGGGGRGGEEGKQGDGERESFLSGLLFPSHSMWAPGLWDGVAHVQGMCYFLTQSALEIPSQTHPVVFFSFLFKNSICACAHPSIRMCPTQLQKRAKEGIGSPETRVTVNWKSPDVGARIQI